MTVMNEENAAAREEIPETIDAGPEPVSSLTDMYDLLKDTMEAGIGAYVPGDGAEGVATFDDVLSTPVEQPFVDYAGDVRESADLSDLCAAVNSFGEDNGIQDMGFDAFEDALERFDQDVAGDAVDRDMLSALSGDMAAGMEQGQEYDTVNDVDYEPDAQEDPVEQMELQDRDLDREDTSEEDFEAFDMQDTEDPVEVQEGTSDMEAHEEIE